MSSTCEDSTQPSAVRVCWAIMSNPAMAPVISHNPAHCFTLARGLASWILEGHRSDEDIEFAQKVIRELEIHLRSQADRKSGMRSVVEHLLLPMARLNATFKENENPNVKKLVTNYKMTVTVTLFESELLRHYEMTLDALFAKESKATMSEEVKMLFETLISAIENEPVEVASCLLSDVFSQFIYKYHNQPLLHFKFLIVLCYLIGLSPSKTMGSSVIANSIVGHIIKPPDISQTRKERLLLSLLKVVEFKSLDLSMKLGIESLKAWLGKVMHKQLFQPPASTSGFKCFSTLIAILPQMMANLAVKSYNLLLGSTKSKKTDTPSDDPTESKEAMYLAFEDLFCEILNVYDQLRDIPKLIEGILQGLKNKPTLLSGRAVVSESLIIYEGHLLLPPR